MSTLQNEPKNRTYGNYHAHRQQQCSGTNHTGFGLQYLPCQKRMYSFGHGWKNHWCGQHRQHTSGRRQGFAHRPKLDWIIRRTTRICRSLSFNSPSAFYSAFVYRQWSPFGDAGFGGVDSIFRNTIIIQQKTKKQISVPDWKRGNQLIISSWLSLRST